MNRASCLFATGLMAIQMAFVPEAFAGDFAEVEIHGFSEDGSRFVFEQYGIQDGSGFPYSELFAIDVVRDSWITPSPIKFLEQDVDNVSDYDALLAETRHVTLQAASDAGLLDGITQRGNVVGMNPVTELSANPHRMIVSPRLIVPPVHDPMEFVLEELPIASDTCAAFEPDTKGFRLTMNYHGKTRVLNADKTLPKSRGCPLRYSIERVITHYPNPGNVPQTASFAVLILMQSFGFEGPDGRYLAITGTF